jgi:hypothetical protein
MNPARPGLWLAAVLIAGCATSGSRPKGPSRPQVVVLAIGAGTTVQARVEELVTRRFDIISDDAYRDAARRLDAVKMTRKNIAKVAGELGAIALVHGKATGKKKRQVVTIYVRDAESGKLLERHRLTVRRGVVAKKGNRRLAKRLLAKVKGPAKPELPVEEEEPATASEEEPPGKTAAKPDDDEEEPDLPPVQYDEGGQAVDDEIPPM